MGKRLWMPLYIGDLEKDTMHLGATEFGIYMRLIMHCWERGFVPADNRKIALIAKCSNKLLHKYKTEILSFFVLTETPGVGPVYIHNRVNQERLRSDEISNKRKAAALQKHTQSQSQSQSQKKERKIKYGTEVPIPITETPSSRLFREGKPMLVSMGTSEKTAGSIIGRWLKVNGDPEGILAAISYARDFVPIEPIAYVTKLLQQKVKPNGTASARERAFQAAERLRQMETGSQRGATGSSVVSFPIPQR